MITALKISILGLSFATNILDAWWFYACDVDCVGLLTSGFSSWYIGCYIVCTLDSVLL